MRFGRRGTTALEFALAAPALMILMFGGLEFGRLQWTWQAMQLAGDQTARCVAISGTACTTPSTYAVSAVKTYGAITIPSSDVTVATSSTTGCGAPSGNKVVQVTLSVAFTSPFSKLVPALSHTLTTTSCYPLTGN